LSLRLGHDASLVESKRSLHALVSGGSCCQIHRSTRRRLTGCVAAWSWDRRDDAEFLFFLCVCW